MKQNKSGNFLRLKSRLYLNLLIFLGMISFPLFFGCSGNSNKEMDQKRINDSLSTANHDLMVQKAKADSTAKAEEEKAKLDSIAREDSIAKAKKQKQNHFKPQVYPTTKYGVKVIN
jgi:hypothetical protein